MYQKVRLRQNWRSCYEISKHYPIFKISVILHLSYWWSWPTIEYSVIDKLSSTGYRIVGKSQSSILSSSQIVKHWIIRCVAFHDIPLKGSCIVSNVDIYFRWVTIRYILIKGVYIVGTPKFSGTLKRERVFPFGERFIISVSFKIYGYSPISPIGRIEVTDSYLDRE